MTAGHLCLSPLAPPAVSALAAALACRLTINPQQPLARAAVLAALQAADPPVQVIAVAKIRSVHPLPLQSLPDPPLTPGQPLMVELTELLQP